MQECHMRSPSYNSMGKGNMNHTFGVKGNCSEPLGQISQNYAQIHQNNYNHGSDRNLNVKNNHKYSTINAKLIRD